MELIDLLAVIATAATLAALWLPARLRPEWSETLPALAAMLTLLHMGLEGARWQMIPTYLVVLSVLMARALFRWRPRWQPSGNLLRATATTSGVLLLALSAALSWAFPMFTFPAPTGPFAVGTTERVLETAPDSRNPRDLLLRIWYPAIATDDDSFPYWRAPLARSRAVTDGVVLPFFTFSHLGLVDTHSVWDAEPDQRQGPWPVIVLSHGLGVGWAASNTPWAENMASQGFMVVAIEHPGLASLTIYPNGQTVEFDRTIAETLALPPPSEASKIQAQLAAVTTPAEQLELYLQGMELMPESQMAVVARALDALVSDQRDTLTALANTDFWPGAIEQQAVLAGVSLGGCAAQEACNADARCAAAINFDGFHPRLVGMPLQKPTLLFSRAEHRLPENQLADARAPAVNVQIAGPTHFNFFDFTWMSPLYRQLGVLGEIESERLLSLLTLWSVQFLDNPSAPRLPDPELWPEVRTVSANINLPIVSRGYRPGNPESPAESQPPSS